MPLAQWIYAQAATKVIAISLLLTALLVSPWAQAGRDATANQQDGSQTATSQSTSVLSANKGNLTLVAANAPLEAGPSTVGTVTTQGAELLAGKTVTIKGAAVDLQAIKDATSSLSHSESKTFTIGAAPAGLIGKAVLAISDNIALSQNTQNERLKGAAQLKAGYDAYKFANGGAKAAAAASAAPKGDPGSASIGISISVDSSSSSQDASASKTQSRGTNVQAKDIVIQATQGDITATAAKLQADNITLDAAKNVNLIAAANLETNTSSNHSDSAGVGVTVGLGQNSGISFQLRAAQAQGRSNGTETTFDNTQVTATKNLTVKSGTDTNLIGAQLAAETVKMEVGTSGKGALNIETLQNTSTFKSEQSSTGFDMSLCIPPICYGVPVTVSVSVSQQAIDHNYISAVGQSGVAAGSGGFDIAVAGNTDLKGAAITSSASADKNKLATQSLSSSDLANAQSTRSSSSSITVGNNLTAMVVSNVLANLAGKDGLPENGSQSGKTLSVISPGAVTITGSGNATTDAASGQQVALLTSRDASTANGALTNTLTLQQAQGLQAKQKEIQENMQAGQLVGSVAYNMAGDIAKVKNDQLQSAENLRAQAANEKPATITSWGDSSPEKIALHAIAGFIQASAAGRNGATGALAGAANEALTKTVNDAIDKAMQLPANATEAQKRDNAQSRKALAEGAAQLIGMGAVALGGGNAQDVRLGGAVALNADRNNRQLHISEKQLIEKMAKDKASQSCKGSSECETKSATYWTDLMERAALSNVDEKANAQNLQYLSDLAKTAKQSGSEGALGAVDAYFSDYRTALSMLATKAGQVISVNGQTTTSYGTAQTYFSATAAQRADSGVNDTFFTPKGSIVPNVGDRDATRLENFAAQNGTTTPMHVAEEALLGGAIGGKLLSAGARFIGELDVFIAGATTATKAGTINAGNLASEGLAAKLTAGEARLLSQIDGLPSTGAQGSVREIVADSYFQRNGFKALDGKCGSGNCFDGVYIKGDTVYINEVKPLNANGTIKLSGENPGTTLQPQMSNEWILGAVERLDKGTAAQKEVAKIIQQAINDKTLVKVVSGVDSTGLTIVKLK